MPHAILRLDQLFFLVCIDMYLFRVKTVTNPDNRIAYHFSPIHPSYSKTRYMFNTMFEYVSLYNYAYNCIILLGFLCSIFLLTTDIDKLTIYTATLSSFTSELMMMVSIRPSFEDRTASAKRH